MKIKALNKLLDLAKRNGCHDQVHAWIEEYILVSSIQSTFSQEQLRMAKGELVKRETERAAYHLGKAVVEQCALLESETLDQSLGGHLSNSSTVYVILPNGKGQLVKK